MKVVQKEKRKISIFRTSVKTIEEVKYLQSLLDIIVGQGNWNFDLEDKDNILRINSHTSINNFLVQEIGKLGFECTELF